MIKTGIRILAVVVALTVLATGPLAPLAAAQIPAAPPMPPMPPTEQPVVQQPQDLPEPESRLAESAAYNVGAAIANVFYIPGKGLLCGLGGAAGIFIMIVSVGSAPKPAAYFAREGCGGSPPGSGATGGAMRGGSSWLSPRSRSRCRTARTDISIDFREDYSLGRGCSEPAAPRTTTVCLSLYSGAALT